MLEFWITFLLFVGFLFIYFGVALVLEGDSLGFASLIFGGMMWYGVFALSQDYYPPNDLEIPKTCRQAPIQTSQEGVNFIEVDSEFINLNDKFGRSFENGQIIWIQETLPVKFVSFYSYERSTEGSFEILLQKPEIEENRNEN